MTVMLVTVHERTREIGIKKAIGASRRIILFEFLAESAVLSFIGGISGLLFGTGAGFVGCLLLGLPFSVDAKALLFCVLFSVVIGHFIRRISCVQSGGALSCPFPSQ